MAKRKPKWMKKVNRQMDKKGTKGALREELDVKEGETIPDEKLQPKKGDSTRTKRRKALARTFKKTRKSK